MAEPSRRDPWFDNAKMFLVTAVVVGHSWTLVPETEFNSRAYNFVYLWHIPAFVMVSGYLSRRMSYSRRSLRRLFTTLVIPYLVFEGALAAFRTYVGGEHLERVWLNPHWPMWYLAVLCLWRLVTPLLLRVPYPMLFAVMVSLVSGAVPPSVFDLELLDLSRALGMLPFYVLGLTASTSQLARLRSRPARLLAVPLLGAAVWFTGPIESRWATEWLYFRRPYAELDASWSEGVLTRALFLGVCLVVACAVLSLLPRSRGWFGAMGAYSLVVYLFHGFAVKSAEYLGFEEWSQPHPVLSVVLVVLSAVSLALFLAWRPVGSRLARVVTPIR